MLDLGSYNDTVESGLAAKPKLTAKPALTDAPISGVRALALAAVLSVASPSAAHPPSRNNSRECKNDHNIMRILIEGDILNPRYDGFLNNDLQRLVEKLTPPQAIKLIMGNVCMFLIESYKDYENKRFTFSKVRDFYNEDGIGGTVISVSRTSDNGHCEVLVTIEIGFWSKKEKELTKSKKTLEGAVGDSSLLYPKVFVRTASAKQSAKPRKWQKATRTPKQLKRASRKRRGNVKSKADQRPQNPPKTDFSEDDYPKGHPLPDLSIPENP